MDGMIHKATDGEIQEAANKAMKWADDRYGEGFWESLDVEREDAMQEAMIASYKALATFDGSSPVVAWMFLKAKFGLRNYVAELRKDQEKRSSARVVQVGLDDEEVIWNAQEVSLDDEDCGIQLEAPQEVHGEEAHASDRQVALRALIDTMLMGTLESRERRVIRLRFGFDGEPLTQAQIAKVTGMSQPTVYRVLEQAMETLRAELRAEEIVGM